MVLLFFAFFLGCTEEVAECSEDLACGFGEVCQDGTCLSQSCATSTQCDMESYCDQGSCVDGCLGDSDCFPGDSCNVEEETCEEAHCTDSHIDCDFKEVCNSVTGDCSEASGIYCKDCEQNNDCGGNGNVCMHWGLERDFCGVTCDTENDCPAGFTCIDWNDTETGQLVRQCATYCWLYTDIQSRPVPPDSPNANSQMAVDCPEAKVVDVKETAR